MVDENQEHKQSDEAETIKMGGEDSHKHCALSIKSLFSPFFDILALWFISLSEKKKKKVKTLAVIKDKNNNRKDTFIMERERRSLLSKLFMSPNHVTNNY